MAKTNTKDRKGAGAYVLAAILLIATAVYAMSNPITDYTGKVYYITQGGAFFAVLTGGMAWSMLEIFTSRGAGFWDLAIRFIVSFIPGTIIGYVFGAVSNIGQLLLVPANEGNALAGFMLFGTLFFAAVIYFTAAYLHNHRVVKRGRETVRGGSS